MMALSMGCVRNTEPGPCLNDGEITLYATAGGAGTKTVLQQDGTVFWNQEDCINVFYGGKSGKFTSTNEEKSASAAFVGTLEPFVLDGTTEFVAAYPYSEETTFSGNKLDIKLPSEQLAQEGTFADDLYICVAKSKDYNLFFYNVCGGVKFSLGRDDIKKVVFRGNDGETLAGRLSVEFDSDGKPVVSGISEGKSSVTIVPPDGGTFKKWSFYYLVLVPQSLQKGYTIELYTDELAETINSDSAVTVRRSAWGVLKDMGTVPEAIDLGLSVKWASFNLGSTRPEEYGDYFAWGETTPKSEYTWTNYKFRTTGDSWDNVVLSKYNTYRSEGPIDNKTILELADDAVRANWGGSWRMPTIEEFVELFSTSENETDYRLEWIEINDHKGWKITYLLNGNSIFLPAAGDWSLSGFNNAGSKGYYWSSSLNPSYNNSSSRVALNFYFDKYWGHQNSGYRYEGYTIRPVTDEGVRVSVTGISLDMSTLTLVLDERKIVTATVSPSNATQKNVIWQSSNTLVATVNQQGLVAPVAPGTATITATTYDGGFTATCAVTIKSAGSPSGIEAVDLGLPSGIKWASCNLGATKPEEYGDYYAWGETSPYYESGYAQSDSPVWRRIPWSGQTYYETGGYCAESYMYYNISEGDKYADKTLLDLEDDAAHEMFGDDWRIPSWAEMSELRNKCTWELTMVNGSIGYRVTGPNGNSIFLPSAGDRSGLDKYYSGNDGLYWTSTRYPTIERRAMGLDFDVDGVNKVTGYYRYHGFTIRPVYGYPPVPVESVSFDKTELKIAVGEKAILEDRIVPENATFKSITVLTSNSKVATLAYDENGAIVVTGVSEGSAVITIFTTDGRSKATCTVVVSNSVVEPEAVDLGLPSGVKWASFNVGATKPEECGDYFAWGETSPKDDYSWPNYKFRTSGDSNTNVEFSKYNTTSSYGLMDNKALLELDDDAAHVNWGGSWRMPTHEEFLELIDNCTTEWTTRNGVYGIKCISVINGNSIFLPADGDNSFYWFSSLRKDQPIDAFSLWFTSSDVYSSAATIRCAGSMVRPVSDEGVRVSVTGISLYKSSHTMAVDKKATMIATVTPSNATRKDVVWSSSNPSVATVSWEGVVTAVAIGTATITATTYDGGFTATCTVTVKSEGPTSGTENGHEYVDLGLPSGLKWATCNVGANAPEEYGDYFAWGETEPYYSSMDPLVWKPGKEEGYNWLSYKWCNDSFETINTSTLYTYTLTKYNNDSSYGPVVDNKTRLDLEDDAASVNWGGDWRMPTADECDELCNNCTVEKATQNGINGMLFTSNINGTSIFLPCAGACLHSFFEVGSIGRYWSSSIVWYAPNFAIDMTLNPSGIQGDYRLYGYTVRPVIE